MQKSKWEERTYFSQYFPSDMLFQNDLAVSGYGRSLEEEHLQYSSIERTQSSYVFPMVEDFSTEHTQSPCVFPMLGVFSTELPQSQCVFLISGDLGEASLFHMNNFSTTDI